MVYRLLLLVGGLMLLGAAHYQARSYTITDDYVIHFDGSGAEGTFRGLQGTIVFDPDDLAGSRMDVTVDASSIETGNSTKDAHARGQKWFHVDRYPEITYVADEFRKTGDGFVAEGTLTLRGVSKQKPLPFTFEPTPEGGIFTGRMTVDREAFGIEGPWLAFTVGDDFEVELRVPVK